MKNLNNPNDLKEIINRLDKLKSANKGKWGKLRIEELIPHLTDPIRCVLGEKDCVPLDNPVLKGPVGKLMLRYLPWPKGAPTSKSFLPGTGLTDPVQFEKDKSQLVEIINRFVNTTDQYQFKPNPVFGQLSKKDIGRLYWRHLDHHLKQFGVD